MKRNAKRKKDLLKELLVLNVVFLALCVVITINLIETGGKAPVAQTQTAVEQPAS
jgi:hypothetical protein